MLSDVSVLYLVLLFLCLVASAFFSSAETAFVSLPRTRVKHMVSTGVGGAERVERMMAQPERLLATVLLCNNFVNVAAAALGTAVAVTIWAGDIGVLIATIVVTILLLIFAEVTPKTPSTIRLLRELNQPETRRGIGRLLQILKTLGGEAQFN